MKAEIYNYQIWITLTDPEVLESKMEKLLDLAEFRVLKRLSHRFEPIGYTAVWLLAESHLAVHSFPEAGKTYVELSSCNKEKTDRFEALLKVFTLNNAASKEN